MERKIGEIFEYNGEWYQCVVAIDGCRECSFRRQDYCTRHSECLSEVRSDGMSVIFKKLEKVGEPYASACPSRRVIYFQRYGTYIKPIISNEIVSYTTGGLNFIDIEIQTKEDMEEKKLNLKPFDIQKAREGKPVCTRDGRKARIICFDLKNDEYPIVAAVGNDSSETLFSYTTNGEIADGIESDKDLMMLPEKKEGWVNVYKKEQNRYVKGIFPSREIALNFISEKSREYIATIKITWEE